MAIFAMKIWEALQELPECYRTRAFFLEKLGNDDAIKTLLLAHGSANFDGKPQYEDEHPLYKVFAYISGAGYMDMHIRQNQVAFETYLRPALRKHQKVLFVDYGCGPMTAGLVLAEYMSAIYRDGDYRDHVYYLGIDRSENMRRLADGINQRFKLFSTIEFGDTDAFGVNDALFEFNADIAILNFSYVLSPKTFVGDINELAIGWVELARKLQFSESKIIYQNPKQAYFHKNWNKFVQTIKKESGIYTGGTIEDCAWKPKRWSAMARICGEHKR